MKSILIIAVIIATGIGILQRFKLSDLNAETTRLEAGKTTSAPKRGDRSFPGIQAPPEATAAQLEVVRETMIAILVAYKNGAKNPNDEWMKQLLLAAGNCSGKDIASLVNSLPGDPRLAGVNSDEVFHFLREIFADVSPFAWRDFLQDHRDLPNWQGLYDSAISQCLQADSIRAIQQFEEESARGNRDFASSDIRTGVLLKLAASDPDKMLAMAASPEFSADPDALAHLGGFVDDQLKKPEEHHRFLAALRRATEKQPDSPLWQTIRKDYVREMAGQLATWSCESMETLVGGEFSREEKLLVAEKSSHRGDLNDIGKWADWFLSIDPAEWDRWIVGQPQQFKHPVLEVMGDWGRNDVEAASVWLEKMPPSELRTQAVYEHAWILADRHPDRAASYLSELPESKDKQSLVEKIEETKR